jgi:ABC-type ATPase with predicted acetyltransferase domain
MDSREAKPTAEQVRQLDVIDLLAWIKENRPEMLKVAHLNKLQAEEITGNDFLDHAGDVEFFNNSCGLPAGPSNRLSNLARELAEAGGETAGIKSKPLSFISCAPCIL